MATLLNMKVGAFVISLIVVVLFAVVVALSLFHPVSDDNKVALVLLGSLTTNFSAVVAYWIGSSSGSRDKDDVIAKQADTSAQATAVAAQVAGVPPATKP